MDFDFSDDQEMLRDTVRKWVDKDYDFELCDLVAEAHVVVDALALRDALQPLELALGAVDVGDVGALVGEQVLGIGPALVPVSYTHLTLPTN